MKKIILLLKLCIVSVFSFAQSNCANLDFEDGDFTNWTLTMGSSCSSSSACYSNPTIGTNSTAALNLQRHVICNTTGNDPDVMLVNLLCPFTNSNSVRLGNYSAGNGAEEIFRNFQLNPSDTVLKFHYAYVNNEPGHGPNLNPFFLVEILDSLGNSFTPAINFYMESNDTSLDTIASSSFVYKNWSTINFDISAVKGREVRLRILNSDCAYGGHLGRVYFDYECIGNTTTIQEDFNSNVFNVFPNPTNRNIKISTESDGEVYFYSIKGDLLNYYKVSQGKTEFDLNYNKGVYFVKFTSKKGEIKTKKIQLID